MAARREKIVSLGNAILAHVGTEEELNKKIERVLNELGELNYQKQTHEQAVHEIECNLHEKETLIQALSYAKVIVSQNQGKEGVSCDEHSL
ncbi:hypothetical protein [Priestia megaterium]|uniref:hypothetical protein n=1 Tax=Priestia megaterium TaxID=1404 RepID=UPI0015B278FB|nr:hypothetical protein [Priestia megaterium]QLC85412.1 hypothetical protein HW576_02280 [Priestia megaterium]